MTKKTLNSFLFLFVLFILFGLFSCSTNKNIEYFQDIPDSGAVKKLPTAEYKEPKIQVDDILTIIIQTVDPGATSAINIANVPVPANGLATGTSGGAPAPTISGILVNKEGDVEMPVIGKIHVAGLTTNEARALIRTKAEKYFKDPAVIIRYANFKITVGGEVSRPATYVLPNEKVTIMDGLTMAGDLTIYGKRENILLLRDNEDGTKTAYRVNLNKSNLLNEPFYYLHQNDYIYVEPSKGKAAANDLSQTKTIAIIGTALSLLVIIASRIKY
jgi:polysaccharide export outer membrane protein